MKWDRVLVGNGTFKDKRYIPYFIKIAGALKNFYGAPDHYRSTTGATFYKLMTEGAMVGDLCLKRCSYRTLKAVKLFRPHVHDVVNSWRYEMELAMILPQYDLIIIEDLAAFGSGQYVNNKWVPAKSVIIHNNKMTVCQSNNEVDLICRVAAASGTINRLTVDDIFNLFLAKGKSITLEDFHDPKTNQQEHAITPDSK